MTAHSRLLAALLLAGASSCLIACEDDDPSNGGSADAGGDADMGDDEDGGDTGGGDDGGGTGGGDGGGSGGDDGGGADGGGEPLPEECPDHPNVTTSGKYCVIAAPQGNEIKEDLILEPIADKDAYILSKSVFVGEDIGPGTPASGKARVTLTVKPGTKVLGADNLSFLLINRGSKIMAEGTKDNPVVFGSGSTSAARPGRWGGVVINGRAPSNAGADVSGEAGTGKYGGTDENDNSGVLKYVRIEFGGGKVDDMNELNGLALQGVGKGTTLDYIHVHGNDDDGIEFFGGTVDAKHLIITAPSDDGIDWVNGWNGRIQYAIVQQWDNANPGSSAANDSSNGIEADNASTPTTTPVSEPTLSNITLIGSEGVGNAFGMMLRRGTFGHLHNVLMLGFGEACITLRGGDSAGAVGDALTIANSRMFCDTKYEAAPGKSSDADPAAAEMLFEGGDDNELLADKDSSLKDAYSHTPDFTPADGSGLLTGGAAPSDNFFTDADFIGAVGAEDWTEGAWFKVTEF
jgi:hypothetical protein